MSVQEKSSNRLWVEHEFAGVSLGHKQRDERLLKSATAMADRPEASNPQRMNRNELRSFYAMLEAPRAQLDLLQQGHRDRTRGRMLACPHRKLIVHDTTDLDFTSHPAVHAELGPIGDGDGVGLLQHNSVAFDPVNQEYLGLIYQQLYRRPPRRPKETRQERAQRANKESRLWLNGLRGVGTCPEGQCWVDVFDRGGDFYEAMQLSRQLGHHFLLRVYQDRRLQVTETDELGEETEVLQRLHPVMATIAPVATKVVKVASKGGRPGREVTVQVGYQAARLQPPQPDGWQRGLLPLSVTLIRVWEDGALEARAAAQQAREQVAAWAQAVKTAEAAVSAAQGAEALAAATATLLSVRERGDAAKAQAKVCAAGVEQYLDWWLSTSLPIQSSADALQAVDDYEWRWPVAEEYHKVEKSGLRLEGQRFETAAKLMAVLALIGVMAIRLLQLRYARDAHPEAPAETVATAEEIDMVASATDGDAAAMTVKGFVDGVASLGGYLGHKCDGPPGWQSLWRGYQRLTDMLLGQRLGRRKRHGTAAAKSSIDTSP